MTENEAIKVLVTQKQCIDKSSSGQCKINCGDCKKNIPIAYQEKSYEVAITALKEIQQYRGIGTVEEIKSVKKYIELKRRCGTPSNTIDLCAEYVAIGTVEECREAVERRKPKRAVFDCMIGNWEGRFNCPACGKVILRDYSDVENTFCERCGQAIRWG